MNIHLSFPIGVDEQLKSILATKRGNRVKDVRRSKSKHSYGVQVDIKSLSIMKGDSPSIVVLAIRTDAGGRTCEHWHLFALGFNFATCSSTSSQRTPPWSLHCRWNH